MSANAEVLRLVAEQLVRFRTEEGLSLEEASEESKVDYERLAAAEAGDLALDESELTDLAETYGIELTAFFGGQVTPMSYLFGA